MIKASLDTHSYTSTSHLHDTSQHIESSQHDHGGYHLLPTTSFGQPRDFQLLSSIPFDATPFHLTPSHHLDTFERLLQTADVIGQQRHLLHQVTTTLEVAHAAAHTIHRIHDQLHENHGERSTTEIASCAFAGAVAGLAVRTVGGTALTSGIPAFAGEVVANPSLLAAAPTVANLLVQGYHNIDTLAEQTGERIEDHCHALFGVARYFNGVDHASH